MKKILTILTILSLFYNVSYSQIINDIDIRDIKSEYVESQRNGVEGNSVEFVPNINIKSGVKFGFNDLLMLQMPLKVI